MKFFIKLISLSVILTLAAVFLCACSGSGDIEYAKIAENRVSSDGFTYDVYENNTAQIKGIKTSVTFLEIPQKVDGYRVVSIGTELFSLLVPHLPFFALRV